MSFDAHQMDVVLLVGAAVLLVAILAVRLSVGAGLPSLLVYLLMGVLLGEAGSRHPVRGRQRRPRARLRGARADPRRGWSHHAVGRDQTGDAARGLARDGRRRGQRDGGRGRRALPVRARLAARGAARCGHLAHRRGRGVLGAAAGAAAAPPDRRARGRVRSQRRPHGAAGHAGQHRGGARPRGARLRGDRGLRAAGRPGAGPAGRLRRRVGDAPGGAAVLRPLPARGALPHGPGVRRHRGAARLRVRGGLRRRPGDRQQRAAAPRRDPVVQRGGRVAGADRAVRDARAAGLAEPHHAGRRW